MTATSLNRLSWRTASDWHITLRQTALTVARSILTNGLAPTQGSVRCTKGWQGSVGRGSHFGSATRPPNSSAFLNPHCNENATPPEIRCNALIHRKFFNASSSPSWGRRTSARGCAPRHLKRAANPEVAAQACPELSAARAISSAPNRSPSPPPCFCPPPRALARRPRRHALPTQRLWGGPQSPGRWR